MPALNVPAEVLDGPERTGLRNVENSAIDLFTDLVRVTTTQEGMRQVQEALNGVSDLVQTSARSEDARPRSSRQGGAA